MPDYQDIIKNKEKYVLLDETDLEITNENLYALIYFNGQLAHNCTRANSKEGWIEIYAVNYFPDRFVPYNLSKATIDFYCEVDENNKRTNIIRNKLYGDVVIIKCNEKMEPILC